MNGSTRLVGINVYARVLMIHFKCWNAYVQYMFVLECLVYVVLENI